MLAWRRSQKTPWVFIMSRIFYDHLLSFGGVKRIIWEVADNEEERHELWHIVDEIVHHDIFGCVFDHLPIQHHGEFLDKFHEKPHDETLLVYLTEKMNKNAEQIIRKRARKLALELLRDIEK